MIKRWLGRIALTMEGFSSWFIQPNIEIRQGPGPSPASRSRHFTKQPANPNPHKRRRRQLTSVRETDKNDSTPRSGSVNRYNRRHNSTLSQNYWWVVLLMRCLRLNGVLLIKEKRRGLIVKCCSDEYERCCWRYGITLIGGSIYCSLSSGISLGLWDSNYAAWWWVMAVANDNCRCQRQRLLPPDIC